MKKSYFVCLGVVYFSLIFTESAKVSAETAPFNSSANKILTTKIDLSQVKKYLSMIMGNLKKEAKKYEEKVLNTPAWESELQEEEISGAD